MEIYRIKKQNIEHAQCLNTSDVFYRFRTYRVLNKEVLKKCLDYQISELVCQKHSRVFVAREKSLSVGLVAFSYLPWDTKILGVKSNRIDLLLSSGNYAKALETKSLLIKDILDICDGEKVDYVTCRVDAEDFSSVHALEKCGFNVIDTTATFVFENIKQAIPSLRTIYNVRKYLPQDLHDLIRIAQTSFSRDRFHVDGRISQQKANLVYGEWIRNSCLNASVHVAVNSKNMPVGFFTYQLYEDIANVANYKIIGKNGLMAVDRSSKGSIVGLLLAVCKDVKSKYDAAEFYTQITNCEVIRLFQKFNFEMKKAEYTFRIWL